MKKFPLLVALIIMMIGMFCSQAYANGISISPNDCRVSAVQGQTVSSSFALTDTNGADLSVQIFAAPIYPTNDGNSVVYLRSTQTQKYSLNTKLSDSKFFLSPNQSKTINFSAEVPKGIDGTYSEGIFVDVARAGQKGSIKLATEYQFNFFVTVGNSEVNLSTSPNTKGAIGIQKLIISQGNKVSNLIFGLPINVDTIVQNNGNSIVKLSGVTEILKGGSLFAKSQNTDMNSYPQTHGQLKTVIMSSDKVMFPGYYTIQTIVTNGEQNISKTTSLYYFPMFVIFTACGLLVLLSAVLLLMILIIKNKKAKSGGIVNEQNF